MSNVLVVCELSANHGHSIENALNTVRVAKKVGADAVKIQTYTADTLTIDCSSDLFTLNQGTIWDGMTLYDLYKKAYTPWEWHKAIRDEAHRQGLLFFSTPFDPTSVDFLERLGVPIYKIASFEITDIPLIEYVASKRKPIMISTGIATYNEIQEAVDVCRRSGCEDITLLQCTSSYPADHEDANLATIPDMARMFGTKVGLSDHTMGSAVAVAAVALGAAVIEKHFILDRSIGGPDSTFSMEPDEFASMVSDIRIAEKAVGSVHYHSIEETRKQRVFARSLFVVKDIKKGELFTHENVRSIRPGYGASPKDILVFLGKRAKEDFEKGTPLSRSMILDE